jgi:hypothetical protein
MGRNAPQFGDRGQRRRNSPGSAVLKKYLLAVGSINLDLVVTAALNSRWYFFTLAVTNRLAERAYQELNERN